MNKQAAKASKTKKSSDDQRLYYYLFDFTKINPQINGFDGDIYDPNLKIDVFDPYFYQVMITRFYYYMFNYTYSRMNQHINSWTTVDSVIRIINNTYDANNFQNKAQEFFSMIEMPDQTSPKYKEALVKIFLLTLFETKYNYQYIYTQTPIGNLFWDSYHAAELDGDFQYTFLKYYLEDSKYKDDFRNLVSSDDVNNLKLPFIEIEYVYPQDVLEKIKLMYCHINGTYRIATYHNCINSEHLSNYTGTLSNYYDSNTLSRIRYEGVTFSAPDENCSINYNDIETSICKVINPFELADLESPFVYADSMNYLFEIYHSFYGNLWNILKKCTNIYHFKIDDNLYIPQTYIKTFCRSDYINDCINDVSRVQNIDIQLDDYFGNLCYFDKKLNGKLLANLFDKKCTTTLTGYLIYKDNCPELQYAIVSYLDTSKITESQYFLLNMVLLMSSSVAGEIIQNKINIDKITEGLSELGKKIINKLSPKNCNKLYRDILKKFYNSRSPTDYRFKKIICQLCDMLHQKSLLTIK